MFIFSLLGVKVFVPNFVQFDELDYKQNLMRIENAGVMFPMSKYLDLCFN